MSAGSTREGEWGLKGGEVGISNYVPEAIGHFHSMACGQPGCTPPYDQSQILPGPRIHPPERVSSSSNISSLPPKSCARGLSLSFLPAAGATVSSSCTQASPHPAAYTTHLKGLSPCPGVKDPKLLVLEKQERKTEPEIRINSISPTPDSDKPVR